MQTRLLLTLLAAFAAGQLPGQATVVELYLKPDIRSPKLGQTSLDNPALGQATPALDEARAALGWHTADYAGLVDAFVQDAKIGKDMLPVDGAPVYAGPSEDSPVIATWQPGDRMEIVDTGTWWKIRFAGAVPVHFVLDVPPPLPPVTAAVEQTLVVDAGPPPPLLSDSGAAAANPGSAVISAPERDPRIIPGVTSQRHEGILRQSKRGLGLFAPKRPFYLEGPDGDRLAWIDTRNIVLPGTLDDYLDKRVIVHGERTQPQSSRDWIIHARNLQLK